MNSILFWNYRGARKKATKTYAYHLIGKHKVSIITLIETRISSFDNIEVQQLLGSNWKACNVPAHGLSGGVIICWNNDIVQFKPSVLNYQCLIGSVQEQNNCMWNLIAVYAKHSYVERREIWSILDRYLDDGIPTIIGGDFNYICDPSDKKGGRPYKHSTGAIEEMMERNDLTECKFSGPRFTWTNNKDKKRKIWERLDRVLLNSAAVVKIPEACTAHLPRISYDHCPILFQMSMAAKKTSNWMKFEYTWLFYPQAWRIVHFRWFRTVAGSPAEVLDRKCKSTLKALFFWSRNMFSVLNERKHTLEAELLDLQNSECSLVGLSSEQEAEMICKANELTSTIARIHSWWKQKTKLRWIKDGDCNSKFFQAWVSSRRHHNYIHSIVNKDGDLIDDEELIQDEFIHYFKQKWRFKSIKATNWPQLNKGIDHNVCFFA